MKSVKIPYSKPKGKFNKIMFIAEAPSKREETKGKMLQGKIGIQFNTMLKKAGVERDESLLANVFRYRPVNNKIINFFCDKPFNIKTNKLEIAQPYSGKYLNKKYNKEIRALRKAIAKFKPRVIVAMGKTAAWATLLNSDISVENFTNNRLYEFASMKDKKPHFYKVILTHHPSYCLEFRDRTREHSKAFIKTVGLAAKTASKKVDIDGKK